MDDQDAATGGGGGDVLSFLKSDARFAARYEVRALLGQGGMAIVARARQIGTGRDVAVKVMQGLWDPQSSERFQREGKLLARLKHPNILQLYDLGFLNAMPYMVMELAPGGNLRDEMRDGARFAVPRAVEVIQPCLRALSACHKEGIIHRDLKPDNILFGDDGLPRLADFGLAVPDGATQRLTATGAFVGTARYTAPEVVTGEASTPASDIYAMGVILYELFAGEPPFEAGTMQALFRMIASDDPRSLAEHRPDLPLPIVQAINLCLHKRIERRPRDADELADAMTGWAALPQRTPAGARAGDDATRPFTPARPRTRVRSMVAEVSAGAVRVARARPLMASLASVSLLLAAVLVRHTQRAVPPPPAPSASDELSFGPTRMTALEVAVKRGDHACDEMLEEWMKVYEAQAIPQPGNESRESAVRLLRRAGTERAAIVDALEPIRTARQNGRPVETSLLGLYARGMSSDHFDWWVATSCRRILESSGAGDEGEGLALTREYQDALVALAPRIQDLPAENGRLLAHLLDDTRAVARSLQFFDWSEPSRTQLRVLHASIQRRMAELSGGERLPIAQSLADAWTWGYVGGVKRSDRATLAAGAEHVRALAIALPSARKELEEIAGRIAREARIK